MATANPPNRCIYCLKTFSSSSDVRRHQGQDPVCKIQLGKARQNALKLAREKRRLAETGSTQAQHVNDTMDDMNDQSAYHNFDDMNIDVPDVGELPDHLDPDAIPPSSTSARRGPSVVEIEDPDSSSARTRKKQLWRQRFPAERRAGQPVSSNQGKTAFERVEDEHILKYGEIWGPFADEKEWELAKWLVKNVGHNQADSFLKLPIVRLIATVRQLSESHRPQIAEKLNPSFRNKNQLLDCIDTLPSGVPWNCHDIEVKGDLPDLEKDPTGMTMRTERLELWFRDPLACVEELIGNPALREGMKFAPERVYEDSEGQQQVIDEMWTGSWWWDVQVSPSCFTELID
jgi:hypothetical protein